MNETDEIGPDWDLLGRYVTGVASATERQRVRAWAEADRSNAALLGDLESVWQASAAVGARTDDEWHWQRLRARLRAAEGSAPRPPSVPRLQSATVAPPSLRRRSSGRRWVAAASIVIAVSVLQLQRIASPERGLDIATAVVHETGRGEQQRVVLDDGTTVLLHVASRLEMRLGASSRDVSLEGAAYFDVAADPQRPFTVRIHGAVAEVLGTEFALRAYPGDPEVELVVATGRVAFGAYDNTEVQTVIKQNERGRFRPDVAGVTVDPVRAEEILGWVGGRLVFRDTPVADVLRELAHWYDYEFRADPEIARRPLTATFDVTREPIGDVLGVIALSLDATYVLGEGRMIRFRSKDIPDHRDDR